MALVEKRPYLADHGQKAVNSVSGPKVGRRAGPNVRQCLLDKIGVVYVANPHGPTLLDARAAAWTRGLEEHAIEEEPGVFGVFDQEGIALGGLALHTPAKQSPFSRKGQGQHDTGGGLRRGELDARRGIDHLDEKTDVKVNAARDERHNKASVSVCRQLQGLQHQSQGLNGQSAGQERSVPLRDRRPP